MPPAAATAAAQNNNAAIKAERAEKLREALKTFILQERRRKKEEIEAKLEEERIRKEREARQRENDMTLEDTRGQISKLDEKLTELRNQKQQLFLQLKKVLNEDENRKKQQKDNEMLALQAQQANPPPQQFSTPMVRVQHQQMPILQKPVGNQPVKRVRSPSPPSHQTYYKGPNYAQSKHDDGRRGADYARVLWNKHPTQYQTPGTLFYQTNSNAPPPQPLPEARGPAIIYPTYNLPMRQGYHLELQPSTTVPVSKSDPSQKPTQVYHINLDQPPISQTGSQNAGVQSQKPQVTMEKISDRYHVEIVKHEGPPGHGPPPHPLPEGVVYSSMIPGMTLHPNVMQISGNPGQNQKSAGNYAPGRGPAPTHEQQLARQQQMGVMQGQPGQQQQPQQMHFPRRMF
ncbi:early nodulin-75 [Teleopsis dalmanni]|uniref:early nodulin-75 n=1 Tax=Teleopsis dalmanni TaxID=139649 RepID=UPI0018CF1BCA|nr:early nodulin-75 [Teleopsis dalmanni]